MNELTHVAIFLAAAVLSVALMKRLGFAAVLGYLVAGVLIGPWVFGFINDVESTRHLSEFGVVLLLFVIGLELQPSRLWALRRPIFGMGAAQVVLTGVVLGAVVMLMGMSPTVAVVTGLGLAMSSTAFVLQLLAEKRELGAAHGRASFAILLFQDIAVIPLLAVVPLLAAGAALEGASPILGLLKVILVSAFLVVVSRFVLRPIFRAAAATELPEIFTATTLLVVIGTALLMQAVGLSMTLGAFLAGVLLADSEYRHELQARIQPFEGLLLGLFFISVGMSTNLGLLAAKPLQITALVVGLMTAKFVVMFGLARTFRLPTIAALKLAAALCQGGEFAFILFGLARDQRLMSETTADLITVLVSVSMAATPLIYAMTSRLARRLERGGSQKPFDTVVDTEHQVVIAGFGRFGQVIGRILRALRIPFTALDISPEQIELVRRFGSKAYFGDASNLDLLHAARLDKARILILAVDDPDASTRTAALVKKHFPQVQIFARARNRRHVYRLMDLGVTEIERELYHSTLRLTERVLEALGFRPQRAKRAVLTFRSHDESTLRKAHAIYKDEAQLIQDAKQAMEELKALFEADSSYAKLPDVEPAHAETTS